ncbi:MAG: VapE domain-containing protein [Anaerostipes hadrus]
MSYSLNWDRLCLDTLLIDYFGQRILNIYVQQQERHCVLQLPNHASGCKFDYMLILSGAQGVGKSTFFSMLARTGIRFDEYV